MLLRLSRPRRGGSVADKHGSGSVMEGRRRFVSEGRVQIQGEVAFPESRRDALAEVERVCASLAWSLDDVVVSYRVGEGANGVVFKAHHKSVPRAIVAVKVVRRRDSPERESFLLSCQHPHVARYFAVFSRGPTSWVVVLPFCALLGLDALVASVGPLSFSSHFCHAARHLVAGLGFLHASKVAHADLKPANCLVDAAGTLRLADLGDGKPTPFFSAPELFASLPEPSFAADVWALGVTLIVVATGRVPWTQGGGVAQLMAEVTSSAPFVPRLELRGEGGSEAVTLVARCMERESQKRATVEELAKAEFLKREAEVPIGWATRLKQLTDEEPKKEKVYREQKERVQRSAFATAEALNIL